MLLAGGIGITPLLAMARALDARARPARLLYVGRSRSRMALADELRDLTSVAVSVVPTDEIGRPDIGASRKRDRHAVLLRARHLRHLRNSRLGR